ncbi:winged helix-turn-helix domain-containing protein [Paenibacillus massiliensis]|uniref:winged helix-turn-helix domain-containing protein n=1 Tax=Paenibacillus massiliensis TaxID=225917 RepID=UPI000471D7D6|nr:winged helix-turn-helix domain-containing protein [Paenibacillus massiliensis]
MKNLIVISNSPLIESFLEHLGQFLELKLLICKSMYQASHIFNRYCQGIIVNSETLTIDDLSQWCIMKQKYNVPITFIADDHDEVRQKEILKKLFSIWSAEAVPVKNPRNSVQLSKEVSFDLIGKVIWRNGIAYMLTMTEFKLLCYLLESANNTCNIEHILDEVWGSNTYTTSNSVYVHIRKIREKIEKDPSNPEILVTCHGIGYRINLLQELRGGEHLERITAVH